MIKSLVTLHREILTQLKGIIEDRSLDVNVCEEVVSEIVLGDGSADRGYLVVNVCCQNTGRKFALRYESFMAQLLEVDESESRYPEPFRYKIRVGSVVREVIERLSV